MVTTKKYLKGARKYQQEASYHILNYGPHIQEPKKKGGEGGEAMGKSKLVIITLQSNIEEETINCPPLKIIL